MNEGTRRIIDGVCLPITWEEYFSWAKFSNNEVYANEYAILHSMDLAFCEETNKELQAYRERFTSDNTQAREAATAGARKARAKK